MTDNAHIYKIVITRAKSLESMLERGLDASGRGLHEKVSSVESRLPSDLVRQLRWIATIRNKVVHEDVFEFGDPKSFESACDRAQSALAALLHSATSMPANASSPGWSPQVPAPGATGSPQPATLRKILAPIAIVIVAWLFVRYTPTTPGSQAADQAQAVAAPPDASPPLASIQPTKEPRMPNASPARARPDDSASMQRKSGASAGRGARVAERASGGLQVMDVQISSTTLQELENRLTEQGVPFSRSVNDITKGPVIRSQPRTSDVEGLQAVEYVFDSNETLVGVTLTMAKRFEDIMQHLRPKYRAVKIVQPFVGDMYALFEAGGTKVEVNAPHLSFQMDVKYWRDDFRNATLNALRRQQQNKTAREASKF